MKSLNGIEVIVEPLLPFEYLDEETQEKKIIHMFRLEDTFYVSKEVYDKFRELLNA